MKNRWNRWLVAALFMLLLAAFSTAQADGQEQFLQKAARLRKAVSAEALELGDAPAGTAGHAVFFSVCDGVTRARVYSGTGEDLDQAWSVAAVRAASSLEAGGPEPLWVRADVVTSSHPVTVDETREAIAASVDGFVFTGLSLDPGFETALLEGELNGAGIYDYENDELSLHALNTYFFETGHKMVGALGDGMVAFDCRGWFCDADDGVYPLIYGGADYGRRQVLPLDAARAERLIDTASAFLVRQVGPDGKFVYGLKPQHDWELTSYNILRHSGAVWSLICRYRMFPDEALRGTVENAIDYMLGQIVYDKNGAAYLYEEKSDEVKLGGSGIAVVALTEYMDVFGGDKYLEVSRALGEGILDLLDMDTGVYWHVLNGDLSRKEQFRTVYYDGEATFALARLYRLTGEQRYLDAACRAIERFIADDYTQYRDHWVAYSLNEVTKYVEDRQDFYDFALANARNNYDRIMGRARTFPTNLELLMAAFETWQRMAERGADTGDFDVKELTRVIDSRARRQLSGYFFPEVAMYMARPDSVLGSFMMRDDDFRVRIDDVQHNIGGYYLYWKNYDALLAAGM